MVISIKENSIENDIFLGLQNKQNEVGEVQNEYFVEFISKYEVGRFGLRVSGCFNFFGCV